MATKTFFQQAIDQLNELKTLRVSTYIGAFKPGTSISEADMKSDQGQDKAFSSIDLEDSMLSKIDLLQGDMTTTMTKKFEENEVLREYHIKREEQAHDIVNRNLQVLESVGDLIKKFIKEDKNSQA